MFEIIFAIVIATPICIYSAVGIARTDDSRRFDREEARR